MFFISYFIFLLPLWLRGNIFLIIKFSFLFVVHTSPFVIQQLYILVLLLINFDAYFGSKFDLSPNLKKHRRCMAVITRLKRYGYSLILRSSIRRMMAFGLGIAIAFVMSGVGSPAAFAQNEDLAFWGQASFPVENFQLYTSAFGYRSSGFHYGLYRCPSRELCAQLVGR